MDNTTTLSQSVTKSDKKLSAWAAFWTNLETDRYGYGAVILIGVFCFSAIAMAFGGGEFFWKLVATAISSMALLVAYLVLLPLRAIANIAVVAIVVDLFFLALLLF